MILQVGKHLCLKCTKAKLVIVLNIFTFLILYLLYRKTDSYAVTSSCNFRSLNWVEIEQNFYQKLDASLKILLSADNVTFLMSKSWTILTEDVYVYSAFIERCPPFILLPFCVKFVGITLSSEKYKVVFESHLKCAVKPILSNSGDHFAVVELLPEDHFKKYSASFFFCPFNESILPTHASLFRSSEPIWVKIDNHIHLSHITEFSSFSLESAFNYASNYVENISLCIRPIFNTYSLSKLLEFITYYSSMGVDHFIFYYIKTYESPEPLLKLLNFANVSFEVYKWDIPLNNDLVHEYGQIVFTQDCISRSAYRFQYTLIVDNDEYIVPKEHHSLKEMTQYLENRYPLAGSFVIPMVLFCYEFYLPNSRSSDMFLPILFHQYRQKTLWQYTFRSKYIVKPDRIRYGGVHFVWKLLHNFQEVYINEDIALLHHYKICCGGEQSWFFHLLHFKILTDKVVKDDTIMQFKDKLLSHPLAKLIFRIL